MHLADYIESLMAADYMDTAEDTISIKAARTILDALRQREILIERIKGYLRADLNNDPETGRLAGWIENWERGGDVVEWVQRGIDAERRDNVR